LINSGSFSLIIFGILLLSLLYDSALGLNSKSLSFDSAGIKHKEEVTKELASSIPTQ
jgi:hypothetical protein